MQCRATHEEDTCFVKERTQVPLGDTGMSRSRQQRSLPPYFIVMLQLVRANRAVAYAVDC